MSGDDHHAGDMNGEQTFRQKQRGEQDQRVLRALRTAGTDTTHRDIAARIGVSEDRVYKLAKGIREELAALREQSAAPPAPAGEAPVALARVHCIVDAAEIGARDCVGRQGEFQCFCPKASFAINAIAPTVLPGTRLEDLVAKCRNTARSVLTKPAEERFLGPAREARDGKKVVLPLISIVPLPAPPKNEAEERRPAGPPAAVAPWTTTSKLPERRVAPPVAARAVPKPVPPAPPAKEEAMKVKTEPCKWTEEACDEKVWAGSKSGLCTRHAAMQASRKKHAHTNGKATKPKETRTVADVAAKHATVAGDDVVAILTGKRDFHAAQLARFDRALAALREE